MTYPHTIQKRTPAPFLLIIGGPNGAGKTTFAREFLTRELNGTRFLNTDEIARGLSPFDVESVAFKAGRIFLEEIKSEIKQGNNLAIESTLSGKIHARLIQKAKHAGYQIHLHFLWLPSAKISRQRVTQRKKQGGHDVSTLDINRRFPRILENLIQVYLPSCDRWSIWNGSTTPPKILAKHDSHTILSVTEFLNHD